MALYAALPDEVPTALAFAAGVARKGEVWLPRETADGLEFAPATRWEQLRPGLRGPLEPEAAIPPEALEPGDLVLVPGLAFDRAGTRLGRGGGHYDRAFPPGRPRPVLHGVAFAWQVVDALPREAFDLRVDAVLTELGLQPCGAPPGARMPSP